MFKSKSVEVYDFQLTDDEFEATRDYLPESLRKQMRRAGNPVGARTAAFRKAAAALQAENEFLREYKSKLELAQAIASAEGDQAQVEQLRRENEALRETVVERENEIERVKNRQIAERASDAAAVHSVAGTH